MVGSQVLAVRRALALVVRQELALVLATTPLFIQASQRLASSRHAYSPLPLSSTPPELISAWNPRRTPLLEALELLVAMDPVSVQQSDPHLTKPISLA